MAFRPFGIGGRRRTGPSGLNPSAHISLGIALLSYLVSVVAWNGGLERDCGTWRLNCAFHGFLALVIGCSLGAIVALASFSTQRQRWLSWLALELNAVSILGCCGVVAWVMLAN